jgi:RNA-directed DNA polymerase
MHENRETSETTRLNQSRDRSEKALGRTADRHASEESDCAIVPVNLSNKEEQSSAEMGEGRARAKENIDPSNTRPTQSGERVSQGRGGVRQAAKERKQERFTALLHHVTINLLRDSFYALKRQAAPGVDGVRWKEYEAGLEGRLADLHNRIHRGTYRARASRRVYIAKADGRKRPLGIAALEDKVVRHRLRRLWRTVLIHRSQRGYVGWERLNPLFNRWIPPPRVLHPYPMARFIATYPRWKPYA